MKIFVLFCSLILSLAPPVWAVESVQNEHTKATLLSNHESVSQGQTFKVGVWLQPTDGWHTYWQNPGDAGITTTLEWTLPQGITAGDIEWPLPQMLREDVLVVHGYVGEVLLPVSITLPADYAEKNIPIAVKASWLVCKEICIPESAELSITLPVAAQSVASAKADLFDVAAAKLPKKIETPLTFAVADKTITLTLPDAMPADGEAFLFLHQENIINYSANQTLADRTLTLQRADGGEMADTLSGYLTIGDQAFDITARKSDATVSSSPSSSAANTASSGSFVVTLLFALIGGLILNLMPCVLPVLSLKALAIAKKSTRERKVVVRQALAYTLGVLLSFALIAGVMMSLQQAGEAIGWGYQMQSPVFVGTLVVLLFLVGLNLSGMFDLPVLFGSALQDNNQHGLRGSFLTGVLATAVATPCTAPFMATAVGATLTLSPLAGLAVFLFIGLGLALPFLLIALHPPLLKYLPKPGAWMEGFKQFLAFPMYASVVWLLWVLTVQTGANGLLIILITLLLVTFLIWLKSRCQDVSSVCRIALILMLLAALMNGLSAISLLPTAGPAKEASEDHVAFSETALKQFRADGKAVFVDATAAWCLICQVNKRVAIDTEATRQTFEDTNTVLMIADWTNRNPEITAFLESFGHNGVPLYVYFPISGEPMVLPQLLSESLVIATLKGENPR